jgi:hypothetical protein
MTCYDLDRFRAFVASEGFADVYDVPAGEREAGKRQARDADLMDTAPDGRNNRLVRRRADARGDGTGQ